MKKIWISLILLTIMVAGCQERQTTGLLDDYLMLTRSDDEKVFLYKSSEEPLSGFSGIIVEPVIADFSGSRIRESSIEGLKQCVELSAKKVVLSGFDLATSPAESVAVLKARLSIARSDSPVNLSEDSLGIRGPYLEILITDSLTDETLISMVLARPEIDSEGLSRWDRAVIAIDYWAEKLAQTLYGSDDGGEEQVSQLSGFAKNH